MTFIPNDSFRNALQHNEAKVMLIAASNPQVAEQMGWGKLSEDDVRAAFGDEAASAWSAIRAARVAYMRAIANHFGFAP